MSWRAYGLPRVLPFGASSRYLRHRESTEGGLLVRLADGRSLRVLPDGQATGQRRTRTLLAALTELQTGQLDAETYLRSRLAGVAVVEPADGSEEAETFESVLDALGDDEPPREAA